MMGKVTGSSRWLIVAYLACVFLPALASEQVSNISTTPSHDSRHYYWPWHWTPKQSSNETDSTNAPTLHRHRHDPGRWVTTRAPFSEREPRIFTRPREFYWVNETVEFTCVAFTHGVRWLVLLPETASQPARGSEQLNINGTLYAKDSSGRTKLISTITVFLDDSWNNTNLTCELWNDGNRDSVHLTVYHLPRHVGLGEACSGDNECPANAVCHQGGFCECDRFHERRYSRGAESCVVRHSALGEACIRNYECPANAICDRVCVCAFQYVSQNDDKCVRESPHSFLDVCRSHSECRRWDPNASCKNQKCKCSDGYVYAQGKCWKKIWLGDPCTSDDECSAIVEYSICRNVTSGGFAECDCQIGYRIAGRKCVEHWRGRIISVKTAFIASACILGLILLCIFVIGVRSARLYVMQQKGRHYRNTIAHEKNLSISKYIPMRSKPDLKIQEDKQTVTFCPLPALDLSWKVSQEPELRPVSISEEDKTVGIPENVILIHQDSNQNGSVC